MKNSIVDYWVTGSSGHIGQALTKELLGRGFSVLGIDQSPHSGNQDKGFSYISLDLSNTKELERAISELPKPQRGLIHLAALTGPIILDGWGGTLEAQSLEIWEKAFSVNLTSAFLLAREAVKIAMDPTPQAGSVFSIVFASSIYGTLGPNPSLYKDSEMKNPAAYGASKAALESLARYISSTYGGKVRANSVAAGGVLRNQTPDFIDEYSRRTPIGRMATEEDILKVVLFLLTDESRYVFGQTIYADGGFTLW